MPVTGAKTNLRESVAIARHELCCQLKDVIDAFAWLVRFGGKAALVHRPHRLGDIICLLRKANLEPKRVQLVYPRPGKEANIVLVEAEKGAKPGLKILPPLTIRAGGSDDKG
jgi:tRNA1(Val) A37 N6-methylase TrmN6